MVSLDGRVVEQYSRMGVPNVLVRVGARTAVTDANGYFTLSGVPPNTTQQMAITHRDFEQYVTSVIVGSERAYTVGDIVIRQTTVRAL